MLVIALNFLAHLMRTSVVSNNIFEYSVQKYVTMTERIAPVLYKEPSCIPSICDKDITTIRSYDDPSPEFWVTTHSPSYMQQGLTKS